MNTSIRVLVSLLVGIAIGGVAMWKGLPLLTGQHELGAEGQMTDAAGGGEKKPLYWVAPMDPNYRRDKPGKSPMGMDLIPVYEEEAGGEGAGPGTVKISPDVVNNLGVRTAIAERKQLHTTIKTVGFIQYDEDRLIHIHPRVEGWIETLYIKASGDPVRKGQPLYDLYSPELVNGQEDLVLALERNVSKLAMAAEEHLTSLRVSKEAIRQLKRNRQVKQTVTFYAPENGIVDNLQVRQGFFVKPGSTIMSIGNLSQVWVEAEIFERQADLVKEGLPVIMSLDYLPGKEWQGKVDYVYPTLDPKTRTIRVRLRFENSDYLLKPNMFAQVVIEADSAGKTLLVPKEAVIRTGNTNRVVLALGDGRFKSINVKVGQFDDQNAEILSGLSEGEKVVTSAQFLIDSESSKTSDFKRMHHEDTSVPATVWVKATINTLMADKRMVNLTHEAISQWKWPEMTMDFKVAESVDFAQLKKGMSLPVELTRIQDNQYEITNIHLPGSDEGKSLDEMSLDNMSLDDMSLDGKEQQKAGN